MEPAGIIAVISFHFLETEAGGDSCLFNFGDANSSTKKLGEVNFPLIMFEFLPEQISTSWISRFITSVSSPSLHPNFFH